MGYKLTSRAICIVNVRNRTFMFAAGITPSHYHYKAPAAAAESTRGGAITLIRVLSRIAPGNVARIDTSPSAA